VAKKLSASSGGQNKGKFCSLKTGEVHQTDSLTEMDYLYLLDFDPEATRFKTHPFTLDYVLDGKWRRYTPDVLVYRSQRKQIIEVKPTLRAMLPRYVLLFRTVAPLFRARGFDFQLVTSDAIQQQPRLDNIKVLWKYARTGFTPQHQVLCHEFFGDRKIAPLREISEFLAAHGVAIQVVYSLLFWHVLSFDVNQPLGPSAQIWLPGVSIPVGNKEVQNHG
jgi:TnsA endonuclease-like protein